MFKENKYKKWYFQLIKKRGKFPINEGENHHIIPKSLGGSNKEENKILLTYREHFICHLLLTKMCLDKQDEIKMIWALHKLTFSRKRVTSKEYEICRKIYIKFLKESHHSKRIPNWGKIMSEVVFKQWENNEQRRKKQSEKMVKYFADNKRHCINHLANISKKGARAAKEILTKNIEYNGIIYKGWNELKEKTKITKHLYQKYYLKGIDPSFRIGKDGPLARKERLYD